jgi:hypothetical protein
MRFVGLDLTDPYASRQRPVDVAVVDEHLRCELFRITWSASSDSALSVLELGEVTDGPLSGDVLVIDGPLALATVGRSTRECERVLGAPGHTSDTLPTLRSQLFAGYIRGSVELARTLTAVGWIAANANNIESATMLEAYPGAAWRALRSALPKKRSSDGKTARRALLEAAGVVLPPCALTHDALDAALCALIGYWSRGTPPRIRPFGLPCSELDGVMREGFIMQPIQDWSSPAATQVSISLPDQSTGGAGPASDHGP